MRHTSRRTRTAERRTGAPRAQATRGPRCALLDWPRSKPNGTPLGIDLEARLSGTPPRPDSQAREGQRVAEAIRNLVRAQVKEKRMPDFVRERLDLDDIVGEVFFRILRKNRQACAFDPERASFSKYVRLVASGVISAEMTRANREADLFADPAAEHDEPEDAED